MGQNDLRLQMNLLGILTLRLQTFLLFFNEGKVRVNLTGLMVLERLRGHNLKRVDEFVTRVKETEFNIFV